MLTKEELKMVKSGLIIVDMVNGFLREGALADPKIQGIIEENVRLTKLFIDNQLPIMAYNDSHNEDSLEFKNYPAHCLIESKESTLVDELKEYEEHIKIFPKNSTGGYITDELRAYINNMKSLTELVITGCCTDICVMGVVIALKNFFNEVGKDINIIVPENAIDTYDAPSHNRNEWNQMAYKFIQQAGAQLVKKYEKE